MVHLDFVPKKCQNIANVLLPKCEKWCLVPVLENLVIFSWYSCSYLFFAIKVPEYYQCFISSEAVEAALSKSVRLRMMGVGFSKGGQIWPQICSTSLSFWDRGYWLGHTFKYAFLLLVSITSKLAQLVKAPV